MGLLGDIFGDSDLGCAVGVAISPFAALGTGECDATIEKVVDKVGEALPDVSSYQEDVVDALKFLTEIATPFPVISLGLLGARQINKSLGLSPEAKAEYQHRLSTLEEALLLTAAPLLIPGPVFPVAVGLERYIRSNVAPLSAEEIGSFAADLFTTAAMVGFGGVGAKALSTAVKNAKAATGQEILETYFHFHPFF